MTDSKPCGFKHADSKPHRFGIEQIRSHVGRNRIDSKTRGFESRHARECNSERGEGGLPSARVGHAAPHGARGADPGQHPARRLPRRRPGPHPLPSRRPGRFHFLPDPVLAPLFLSTSLHPLHALLLTPPAPCPLASSSSLHPAASQKAAKPQVCRPPPLPHQGGSALSMVSDEVGVTTVELSLAP